MKDFLINILPVSVANSLRSIKESASLRRVPTQEIDATPLRKITSDMLQQVFKDQELSTSYEKMRPVIDELELPEYTGGVNIGDQRALFYLIQYLKPKRVLEVGTFVGCSTVHIGLALKSIPNAKLTTVDICDVNDPVAKPWVGNGAKHSPQENVSRVDCEDTVSFVTAESLNYLSNYSGEKYDFIFLDGSHSGTDVYLEISKSLKILNKGGLILLHDYFPNNAPLFGKKSNIIPGTYLGAERARKENPKISIIPLGNLPWPTKLGMNMTSLAVLTTI